MTIVLVVDNPAGWPIHLDDVRIISPRTYLTDPVYSDTPRLKVFNLCKSYRYQSAGYYVSLLAAARGHVPLPDINTIQDLKSPSVVRTLSEEIDNQIQKALRHLQSETFTLSIYFGRNMAKRYSALALNLFNLFQAPMLSAEFVLEDNWRLKNIRTVAINDVPESHLEFIISSASLYFTGRKLRPRKRHKTRFDIAILVNPDEANPPSNNAALQKFQKAAISVGLEPELINRDDFHRLAEFDALFIRETTSVNHHTFRFAQQAAAKGLVVIDDPQSILKCGNKVYLAELLSRQGIPIPKTMVVHKGNRDEINKILNLPCVLKQPDSAFSQGVIKATDERQLKQAVNQLLSRSDLVIAQQYLPTSFDWRVGICNRRPLYACRYYMARRHWQIIRHHEDGRYSEGETETLTVGETPEMIINTAMKAANLIGDGLYGVDLKQIENRCYVMEINDNPNIDAGIEDKMVKDALYREIMGVFIRRIEQHKL